MPRLVSIVSNDPVGRSTTYLADDGNTYTLRGDLSARANNPGNISPTGATARGVYHQQFGAIGYLPSSNGPSVAVFPDLTSGQQAQAYLWQTPAYQNRTLDQAASSWATSPYAASLRQAAGVTGSTLVRDLSPVQMQAVIGAQNGNEGAARLVVTDGSGQTLDPAIFTGTHPVPPLNVPGSAPDDPWQTMAQAGPFRSPPAPLPAPAPLTPQSMQGVFHPPAPPPLPIPRPPTPPGPQQQFQTLPPPNLPLNPPLPPNRGASYGPETPQWGPKVNQLGMPPLPSAPPPSTWAGMAAAGPFQSPPAPPVAPMPMPGRPAALQAAAAPPMPMPAPAFARSMAPPPAAAAPTPVQPPQAAQQPMLMLPSGKTIAPGIYQQADGHSVSVTDAGNGMAKVTKINNPGSIPGIIDPLREANNHNTVAGSVIRSMIPQALSGAVSSFTAAAPQALDNAKNQAVSAASNLGNQITGLGSNLGNAFSGMFGGGGQPAQAPRNLPTPNQLAAINDVTNAVQQPIVHAPPPTFVTKTVQSLNPAYTAWQGRNVGGDVMETHGKVNVQAPPPPQYLTRSIKVPATRPPSAATPLSSFNTVNPMSQIAPNIASRFAQSPMGNILQLASGEPVQGGLLQLLQGKPSPPRSQPGVPLSYNPTVDVTHRDPSAGGWGINAGGGIVAF